VEINKTYSYEEITYFAECQDYQIHEFEISETIGKSVIILDHFDKDRNIIFVLTGANSNGYFYKLIYTED